MRTALATLTLACVLVIGLSVWVNRGGPSVARNQAVAPANSDYYMKDATVYQLTPKGQLSYRMKIKQSLHFPDDSVRFTDIHVHYLEGTATYWNLHADKGHIPPGKQNLLYLQGHVTLLHPREDGDLMKAKTTHAWVRPDENQIDTDAPVRAVGPGRTVTGKGMRIDLTTNKLYLQNDVHVSYD